MNAEQPECYYRISVKGLLFDETRKKFLIVQEDNGKWELPGGGIEHGESPEECLRREIAEEMGLAVTWVADNPSFFLTFKKPSGDSKWIANVLYEIKLRDLHFTPSEECVSILFVTPKEAKESLALFPNVYELAVRLEALNKA